MNDPKRTESPEARKEREVLAARDREAALNQYRAAQTAEAAKTQRLRELRLAREAAEAAAPKPKLAKTAKKKTSSKTAK